MLKKEKVIHMTTQRKAELSMVLSQMMVLSDRLDELREQEADEMAALPKRSKERKQSAEVCDAMDDAQDSLVDAIRSLEELLTEDANA